MLWEELTAAEFAQAVVKTAQTCLVPLGVIEKHGDHLPLGTDVINVRAYAAKAAALEPVIIFPPFYIGQICEAQHQPGTLSFDAQFQLAALDRICREISRNGLKKIILLNGHGGNGALLPFFAQTALAEAKDYAVYVVDLTASLPRETLSFIENQEGGHADEVETSLMLATRPDLAHMDRVDREGCRARKRLSHLHDVYTGIWWYADYPDHLAGDASLASAAKGERLLELGGRKLAGIIKAIKADQTVARLQQEFFTRAADPLGK